MFISITRLIYWYCVSVSVPVIVVFTKFDALVTECWGELGEARFDPEASALAAKHAEVKFEEKYLPLVMKTVYPPKAHLHLSGMINLDMWDTADCGVLDMDKEENTCPELSGITASALDDSVLQNLFVSTQMNNLDLCTEYGIR